MRFDELGLPIEDNASDKQDSARLAGFLTTFNWPVYIDLTQYLDLLNMVYMRHPKESKYDLSRDQAVCLMAGLSRNERNPFWVSLDYVDGKDFMSPTIKGHEARCRKGKASLWQDAWLVGDILAYALECLWNIDEPNQLLCMVEVAGKNWLKFFCAITPWKKALRKYWIDTRTNPEIELVEHVIKYVESRIK